MDSDHALLLEPNEFIVFEHLPNTSVTSLIHLKNPSSCNLAFKLKTNSPSSYIVRPTQGILGPHDQKSISVSLQTESIPDPEKDKFLILYTKTAFPTTYPMTELTKFWLNTDTRSVKKAKLSVKLEMSKSNPIQHFVDYTESKSENIEESGIKEEKIMGQKKILNEIINFELKFPDIGKYNLKLLTFVSLVVGFFYCIT